MGWYLFIVVGALLTAVTAAVFRTNPLTQTIWGMVLLCFPLTLLAQYAFAQAFSTAPKFYVVWFTGTAACSLAALLISRYLFRESWKFLDGLGVFYVLVGAALLALGPRLGP